MDQDSSTLLTCHAHRIHVNARRSAGRIVDRSLSLYIRMQRILIGEGQFLQFDTAGIIDFLFYRADIQDDKRHDTIATDRRYQGITIETCTVIDLIIPNIGVTRAEIHLGILGISALFHEEVEGNDTIATVLHGMQLTTIDTGTLLRQEVIGGVCFPFANRIHEDRFLRREDLNLQLVNAIAFSCSCLFVGYIDRSRIRMDTRQGIISGEMYITDRHILILASFRLTDSLVIVCETHVIHMDSNTGINRCFRLTI